MYAKNTHRSCESWGLVLLSTIYMTLGKFHNFSDLQSRQQFLFCFLCLVVVKIQEARITDPKSTFYSLGVFNLLLLAGLGVHRSLSHKAIHRRMYWLHLGCGNDPWPLSRAGGSRQPPVALDFYKDTKELFIHAALLATAAILISLLFPL